MHCLSFVSTIQQMKYGTNVCAKMTNRNHRTKQVDKLLSQENQLQFGATTFTHTHTRLYRFSEL